MALVKDNLKNLIKAAYDKQAAKNDQYTDPEVVRDEIADDLATAIYNWILTATIGTPSGPGTIT